MNRDKHANWLTQELRLGGGVLFDLQNTRPTRGGLALVVSPIHVKCGMAFFDARLGWSVGEGK